MAHCVYIQEILVKNPGLSKVLQSSSLEDDRLLGCNARAVQQKFTTGLAVLAASTIRAITTLIMEAEITFETCVNLFQTTRPQNHVRTHRPENLKYYSSLFRRIKNIVKQVTTGFFQTCSMLTLNDHVPTSFISVAEAASLKLLKILSVLHYGKKTC